MDLYHADLAQPLVTAGEELDDVDHDLSDLSEVCSIVNITSDPNIVCLGSTSDAMVEKPREEQLGSKVQPNTYLSTAN